MEHGTGAGQWHLLAGEHRRVILPLIVDTPGPQSAAWAADSTWGDVWVDEVQSPRAAVCGVAFNYELVGRLAPDSPWTAPLQALPISRGIFCRGPSEATLRAVFGARPMSRWPVFHWPPGQPPPPRRLPRGFELRRLTAGDERLFEGFEHAWLYGCLGSAAELCRAGISWAVLHRGRMACLANVFTRGRRYGDIGVGTQSSYRQKGLALACCGGLIAELLDMGLEPSWTTQPENPASLRLARALGFVPCGEILFVFLPACSPEQETYGPPLRLESARPRGSAQSGPPALG